MYSSDKETSTVNNTITLSWPWYLKAKEQLSVGDYEGALVAAEKALEVNPQSGWAWRLKSDAQRCLGDYTGARASAENADKIAWSWCSKSDQQFYSGNYPAALISAEKAIEIDESAAWAWRLKSGAQKKLGDYKGALISIKKAIEIDPNSEWAYVLENKLQRYFRDQRIRVETEEEKWLSKLVSILQQINIREDESVVKPKLHKDSYAKLLVAFEPKSQEDGIVEQPEVESPVEKNIEEVKEYSVPHKVEEESLTPSFKIY